jgi:hypothetical protein
LPQQSVLFTHDATLLGNLPLTFEERLLLCRKIPLFARDTLAFRDHLLARCCQLRRLQRRITSSREGEIPIQTGVDRSARRWMDGWR